MAPWEHKLALAFAAAAVLIGLTTCIAERAHAADRVETWLLAHRAVMCPPNWRATVSQRYDTRDRRGKIVKARWITRCY